MSKVVINVGGTGAGKTTYTKKLLKKHKGLKLIFDPNKEYGQESITMSEFIDQGKIAKNTLIVFEEATIFFSTSGTDMAIKELLVKKRHTNNFYIFNFHALSQVPLYILMFCDYFVLFKTNDQIAQVERKFKGNPEVFRAFSKVRNSGNKHEKVIIRMR